ncbi:hypothetical protein ACLB2K_059575 [Fragaria x ananassa]
MNPFFSSTTEFVFNTNFNSSSLLLNGNATFQSSILSLTNESTTFSLGRALYSQKIRTKLANSSSPLPFSTSFIFSLAPVQHLQPGHGFAFVFLPFSDLTGASSSQHLGLYNFTNNGDPNNNILGIEFDVFKNQEFEDPNDNHVGVDINSLTSIRSEAAGYWTSSEDGGNFKELKLNDWINYQVWIDFRGSTINVTMARAGVRKPQKPLITEVVDLSSVLLDEMYVGFSGATGALVESHRILSRSFSSSKFSIGDALVTQNLPSFVVSEASVFESKGFIVGVSFGGFLVICCGIFVYVLFVKTKQRKGDEETAEIEGDHGLREFLAEVSSLGRLKHRNLVGLRGWCKKEKWELG